jgi:hypothetical protein
MGGGTERAHLRLGRIVASRCAEVVAKRDPHDRSSRGGAREDRLGDGRLIDRVLRVEHKLSKYSYLPLHGVPVICLGKGSEIRQGKRPDSTSVGRALRGKRVNRCLTEPDAQRERCATSALVSTSSMFAYPLNAIARSRSARKLRSTSATPSAPPSASPHM